MLKYRGDSTARFLFQFYKPNNCPGMPGTHHPLFHTASVAATLTHSTLTAGTLKHTLTPSCRSMSKPALFCSSVSDAVCSLNYLLSICRYMWKQALFLWACFNKCVLTWASSLQLQAGLLLSVLPYPCGILTSLLPSVGLLKYMNRHPSSWLLAPAVLGTRRDNQVIMQHRSDIV